MTGVTEPSRIDEGSFDEAAYLAANLDVKAAVAAGVFKSGWHHYRKRGRREGRVLALVKSRRDKLLSGLTVDRMRGLEIGPLMAPLVAKSEGDIRYVDHADTETLRAKYACDSSVELDRIVPVDHVWGARTLAECLEGQAVDYVLASHVIEHVPDLVTWLDEIRSVLRPDGSLRLAIPDRRYTFDILRRESTLADALDAHMRRARVPLPRAILDHFLNHAEIDAHAVWDGKVDRAALTPTYTAAHALEGAEYSFATGHYQDTHCWVFTPHSFATLCGALAGLDRLDFACESIYPTERYAIEFIAALRPEADRGARIESWERAAGRL